jgi:branched-chain amino acid transport system substrate-binding protein
VPAAEAWEKWTNAHGGINGHPVKVHIVDTACDSVQGQAKAKQLIDSDKVLAIVGSADATFDATVGPLITKSKVPMLGAASQSETFFTNPDYFALGLSTDNLNRASVYLAKKTGATKFAAVVCAEFASSTGADATYKEATSKAGLHYDGLIVASSSAPDYTAECLKLKQNGDDFVQISLAVGAAKKFISDCAAQGYNPTYQMPTSVFDPSFENVSGLEALSVQPVPPYYADAPVLKDFRDSMTQYADVKKISSAALTTWVSLETFKTAMSDASEAPTRQEVFDAVYKLNGNSVGGLVAQGLEFKAGKTSPQLTCFFVGGVKNGSFDLPYGTNPQCLSS